MRASKQRRQGSASRRTRVMGERHNHVEVGGDSSQQALPRPRDNSAAAAWEQQNRRDGASLSVASRRCLRRRSGVTMAASTVDAAGDHSSSRLARPSSSQCPEQTRQGIHLHGCPPRRPDRVARWCFSEWLPRTEETYLRETKRRRRGWFGSGMVASPHEKSGKRREARSMAALLLAVRLEN